MLLLCMSVCYVLPAQKFVVTVSDVQIRQGKAKLSVFANDTIPKVYKSVVKKGTVLFKGSVKKPCYAELTIGNDPRTLFFFVENSQIKIKYNSNDPASSAITGSRTNSKYRYALEQCGESASSSCLTDMVMQGLSEPYAPFLLYSAYRRGEVMSNQVMEIMSKFPKPVAESYHCRLLKDMASRDIVLEDSSVMPIFEYAVAKNKQICIDTMLDKGSLNLLVVGASWCEQCVTAYKTVTASHPEINAVAINIDNDKSNWDSQVMRLLGIDHIPYIILLDNERHILQRDLRVWELDRVLKSMGKKNP